MFYQSLLFLLFVSGVATFSEKINMNTYQEILNYANKGFAFHIGTNGWITVLDDRKCLLEAPIVYYGFNIEHALLAAEATLEVY
jgi:hypothetical protein